MSGYWDGSNKIELTKGPEVFKDGNLGLGVGKPMGKLHVAEGTVVSELVENFELSNGNVKIERREKKIKVQIPPSFTHAALEVEVKHRYNGVKGLALVVETDNDHAGDAINKRIGGS